MIVAREGSFSIGGLDAETLAQRFGTPLFVYDAERVRAAYEGIRAALPYPRTRVHFAAVCNPNLYLLSVLRAAGAGLHANTPGDVYCGLRAGFRAADIVFSGSNLGEEDLRFLFDAGVDINIDSLDDLARACSIAHGRRLGLRIHLEDVLPESRIGLRECEIDKALAIAGGAACSVGALHVYCGTHGQNLERYRRALRRLVALAERLPALDCINLGGGFGYDYPDPEPRAFPFEELGAASDEALRECSRRLRRPVSLKVEPGRALVAGAGVMLTRVRTVKSGGNRRYVGVDATVANLTSPAVHGAHRRVVSIAARPVTACTADVCGCTTYSRDLLAQRAALPEVRVGDLLAVLDCGAYGYCMGSHFLNRPRPAEVFVDHGDALLVTRRETFEDLITMQTWPDPAPAVGGGCVQDSAPIQGGNRGAQSLALRAPISRE